MRTLMNLSTTIKTIRGQVLQQEGSVNNFVYIVREGEFQVVQVQRKAIPVQAEHERVRQFLNGT